MSILRGIFRHHEEDVWQQLSDGVGGDFLHKDGWRNDKVLCKAGEWEVTVDLYSEVGYKAEYLYTRFHTALPNLQQFHFTVHHKSLLARVAKFFGKETIRVGDAELDKTYEVRSINPQMVVQLLASEEIRALIKTEPTLSLRLGPPEGVVPDDPDHPVDELTLMVEGEINDVERLKRLFELFAEVLHGISELFPEISERDA